MSKAKTTNLSNIVIKNGNGNGNGRVSVLDQVSVALSNGDFASIETIELCKMSGNREEFKKLIAADKVGNCDLLGKRLSQTYYKTDDGKSYCQAVGAILVKLIKGQTIAQLKKIEAARKASKKVA